MAALHERNTVVLENGLPERLAPLGFAAGLIAAAGAAVAVVVGAVVTGLGFVVTVAEVEVWARD